MMATHRYLFLSCACVAIMGCTTIRSSLCELRGGAPYVNFDGYQFCGKVYDDGGETCSSSEECEGDCVLPWDWQPDEGREVVGRCEADSTYEPNYGCAPIELHETYTGGCVEE
jgi:hypothetical protein